MATFVGMMLVNRGRFVGLSVGGRQMKVGGLRNAMVRPGMRTYASVESSLNLTPNLEKEVLRLKMAPDNTMRHQQLLFYAKQNEPLAREFLRAENKVPGCLSSVWVVAKKDENGKVYFRGDSDALITKGLVSLLVKGLSGYTAEEIIAVKPEFIKFAGISGSLTPGRNNGFLNMLNTMKRKAAEV
eukprot:CAMPEP_0167758058 /NCGR_PEP_ID=MMETSP0110_2-20121227/10263_1 /TAXON_ID=629695 /ORGANISM="Gymnochlora sp., Strain CCMP2014" /LENGTH=184 /DNA_ID=CAMNT_0007644303 /DNA_START=142 /DNA_END=696 /DNA_ORIENTATION=+